jgi:hypothetical protein
MYLGDDSFLIGEGPINLDDIARVAEESFGMIVRPKKIYVTKNPTNVQFLGYFNRNGLPYKGHSYLLATFIYPEREVKSNLISVESPGPIVVHVTL